MTEEMIASVKGAVNSKLKIIFVDEVIFSPQTILERQWSSKRNNIRQLDIRNQLTTEAVVAGISDDYGLEAYLI